MKKFFALLSVLLIVLNPVATYAITKGVTVSAIVGNINVPATITITVPTYLNNPGVTADLFAGEDTLTVDFNMIDTDSPTVYFTIEASDGSVSVTNGIFPGVPMSPPRNVQFIYTPPAVSSGSPQQETITIAVNDGFSVSSKIINVNIW